MADLGSAPLPPPGADDHLRGDGPEVVLYLDLACPHCAASWPAVRALPVRICVRHFPIRSKRPRSPALHAAAEAAAGLGGEEAFWGMWDSLYEDRGRVDDPHLWARAERLGLDPARFERERRSQQVADRIERDFRTGIRAGVTGTPAAFADGLALTGPLPEALAALAQR